jgi:hypothetical protein
MPVSPGASAAELPGALGGRARDYLDTIRPTYDRAALTSDLAGQGQSADEYGLLTQRRS